VIDWLTLKVSSSELAEATRRSLHCRAGLVMKIAPGGEIEWQTPARESIRSDSHQVTLHLGSELQICGSPARVMSTSNVFGSGDVRECARAMLGFASTHAQVDLPAFERWRLTRLDQTQNYDLGSLANVRAALLALRHAEGGRYQLRTAAESVYWSVQSHLRSGKAYAKGPHIERQVRRGEAELSDSEVKLAQRLLRLELSLKSQWWRERSEKAWHQYSQSDLESEHEKYFAQLVGNVEIAEMSQVQQKLEAVAAERGFKVGRARSAYAYWCLIQAEGFERARELTAKPTHYRHVQLMRAAGLSFADFQARRVVSLRRTPLVLAQPVRSFHEMRCVA
jgi:II/X family phage/plasmid replication protein